MRYLPDDNLSYPVLIETSRSSGSGFYFRTEKKVFLATALHVLFKKTEGNSELRDERALLTSYDFDLQITDPIEFGVDLNTASIRKNDSKDIVLIEVGEILSGGKLKSSPGVRRIKGSNTSKIVTVPTDHLKKFKEVLVSNEVFILGYPNSLGSPNEPQIERKRPLLRKGIIAGYNLANETIILDCPVYFGNSGGMVIEVEELGGGARQYRVIGIVSEYIPFIENLMSIQLGYTNLNFENSGYSVAVPVDTIIELTAEKPVSKSQKIKKS